MLLCWPFVHLTKVKLKPTIMDKSPERDMFHWMREFFNLQFSHFDPLSPFQCCNHVTVSMERISTLKRGRSSLAINKKDVFWNYRRTPIESVCFAQMCQHFCPWLWVFVRELRGFCLWTAQFRLVLLAGTVPILPLQFMCSDVHKTSVGTVSNVSVFL